ncbi:helix-turn-helix domain-containing protein [Paenibacillus sp. Marseille-Q4541]|uniref:PucR family transcriptional regulator n=1 Tax=Paenibacillus sp. Marseille-Q4541 TaxID=2831522 RepID=UPI001BAC8AB9|nr:helix-turn-helix domain-containing protein [Paenibacillus sp. Marseille-Q4541]
MWIRKYSRKVVVDVANYEALLQKLQHILNVPFQINDVPANQGIPIKGSHNSSFEDENSLYFYLGKGKDNGSQMLLSTPVGEIKTSERALIEWIILSLNSNKNANDIVQVEETNSLEQFGSWIKESIEQVKALPLPETLHLYEDQLTKGMIPFYLTYDGAHESGISLKSLNKLLQTYFDGDVLLIPLVQDKWCILAELDLVLDRADDDAENDIQQQRLQLTMEEELAAFTEGLHEVIANEWVGVFHLSVSKPETNITSLPGVFSLLIETTELGKKFKVGEHVYLPWQFHLERLINSIPEQERTDYLIGMSTSSILFEDETISTLETFFQLDCNVSETAKRLYIHRNTLIYRLDKIKQETGLDVRTFKDAVLVKLTLLMYKVTKTS